MIKLTVPPDRKPAEGDKMKTYDQLTGTEQAAAQNKCLCNLLAAVTEGAIRFSDAKNHDNLQARIDAAQEKAEQMRTPWFAHEYILDTCREDLEGMARCDAEDALYLEPGECAINGIIERSDAVAKSGRTAKV